MTTLQKKLINFSGLLLSLFSLNFLVACTENKNDSGNNFAGLSSKSHDFRSLREMTTQEAITDFDVMFKYIETLYAPYQYKERKLGIKIKDLYEQCKKELAKAENESDIIAIYRKFLAHLKDGHVGLFFPDSLNAPAAQLPFTVGYLSGKFFISGLKKEAQGSGLRQGDELLSIDGKTPKELFETILKYRTTGTDAGAYFYANAMVSRPSWLLKILPIFDVATIKVKMPDGTESRIQLNWQKVDFNSKLPSIAMGISSKQDDFRINDTLQFNDFAATGKEDPFFWNSRVTAAFRMKKIEPLALETLRKYGYKTQNEDEPDAEKNQKKSPDDLITKENKTKPPTPVIDPDTKSPSVFAALYMVPKGVFNNQQNVRILLIRQPSYSLNHDNFIAYYRALLDQYEDFADVLVIDQTFNPGGSVSYSKAFAALFAKQPINNQVRYLNADRTWLNILKSASADYQKKGKLQESEDYARTAKYVEEAYDANLRLTKKPVPLGDKYLINPDPAVQWKKPILLLVNEFSGSSGDTFPLVMKANKLATLFGHNTAGLGGNVTEVVTLPFSGAKLRLTRSLTTIYKPDGNYTDSDLIENNGVTPDIKYSPTFSDMQMGYLNYVRAFTSEAVALAMKSLGDSKAPSDQEKDKDRDTDDEPPAGPVSPEVPKPAPVVPKPAPTAPAIPTEPVSPAPAPAPAPAPTPAPVTEPPPTGSGELVIPTTASSSTEKIKDSSEKPQAKKRSSMRDSKRRTHIKSKKKKEQTKSKETSFDWNSIQGS